MFNSIFRKIYIIVYILNICLWGMFETYYLNRCLIPSHSAMQEMIKHGFDLEDCKKFLCFGKDAPRKRKKGTIEKWYVSKNKIYNIVIVESFNYDLNKDVYLIIHIGIFTKK